MTGSRSLATGRGRRLTLILSSPVLLIWMIILGASLFALANLDPVPGSTANAGLARIGDALALVIVSEQGVEIAAIRSLIVTWGIAVPSVVLPFAALLAWRLANRVTRTIDAAETAIESAELERQSRMQEVVHELRTPLAVMGTNLELAAYEAEPGGSSARYVEIARRAVGRMSRTVADLEDHGRLAVAAGDHPVDLSSIAAAVVEENAGPGQARGVQVTMAPGMAPAVIGAVDPAALRTVVGNFMSNALRMAPRGSKVVVDSGELDGWAWLSVGDVGPGLAPHQHARAFERGWQGAHDRDRPGGSGLGLTIARQLTEALGGRITIDSEEGGGSTFSVWIPIDLDADPERILAADGIHPLARPWERLSTAV